MNQIRQPAYNWLILATLKEIHEIIRGNARENLRKKKLFDLAKKQTKD